MSHLDSMFRLPTIADVQRAQQYENDVLRDASRQWVSLIQALIDVVEGGNFTDRHDHALELNQAYIDLKVSMSDE